MNNKYNCFGPKNPKIFGTAPFPEKNFKYVFARMYLLINVIIKVRKPFNKNGTNILNCEILTET